MRTGDYGDHLYEVTRTHNVVAWLMSVADGPRRGGYLQLPVPWRMRGTSSSTCACTETRIADRVHAYESVGRRIWAQAERETVIELLLCLG